MSIPTQIHLEFVTPDRALVHEHVDEVELPGEDGDFGVLPGHAPLLAALRVGPMWYRQGKDVHHAFVSAGFVEVIADRVSVLAAVAERAEDIDVARAEAAKRRAEERLTSPVVEMDAERARIALMRAISRLQVSKHARTRS